MRETTAESTWLKRGGKQTEKPLFIYLFNNPKFNRT